MSRGFVPMEGTNAPPIVGERSEWIVLDSRFTVDSPSINYRPTPNNGIIHELKLDRNPTRHGRCHQTRRRMQFVRITPSGLTLRRRSRKTLSRMLASVGLEVVEYRTHRLYFQLFSLANSLNRYAIGPLLSPVFNLPVLRDLMVPMQISGEMLLIARRPF